MTQTRNVYGPMPGSVDGLPELADWLDDVRRANVEHHRGLIAEAAGRGAGIVCLGELFAGPYFALRRDAFWRDLAEDARDGPTVTAMRQAAAEHAIVVIAPIYELTQAGERFNTAVVIDADGRVLGSYRKCHIPRGINEQGSFDETFYYAPSDGRMVQTDAVSGINRYLPVFDTAAGRVGVAICYDRHFEGVMSGLAAGGARLIFCPAVTFGSQSGRMWDMEFAVDATRHRVFIGGSNRVGAETPWNQPYFGRSHFVGPTGRLDNISDHDNLVIADIDLDALDHPDPSGWDLRRDARPEISGTSGMQ
jgi:N-carbamoylputrescine amidase